VCAQGVIRMLSSLLLAQGHGAPMASQLMRPKPMGHVGAHLVWGRMLGKGAFGSVVESYNRLDGRYSAVKRISFHSVCPSWVPLEQIELRHARLLREVPPRLPLPLFFCCTPCSAPTSSRLLVFSRPPCKCNHIPARLSIQRA